MKRKFAFGVKKGVVEIWKCFENSHLLMPLPYPQKSLNLWEQMGIFLRFHPSMWVCSSTYLLKVNSC